VEKMITHMGTTALAALLTTALLAPATLTGTDAAMFTADARLDTPSLTPATLTHTPANDPFRAVQGTPNTDDTFTPTVGTAWSSIEFPWSYSRGTNIVVAVIDTGVDGTHEDLAGQVLPGMDFVDGVTGEHAGWNDPSGHGTLVAGIIAATAGNNVGITGLAPETRILPVRVLGADQRGTSEATAKGIIAAVDAGANILNLSVGSTTSSPRVADAISYAASKGVIVVASGGNQPKGTAPTETGVNYPAAYPNVIGVGAANSACGGIGGPHIDVVANACRVLSTMPGNKYGYATGTSMATPQVSGEAALLLGAGASSVQVPELITGNTVKHAVITGPDGENTAGTRAMYGSGLIQIPDAVAALVGVSVWGPQQFWGAEIPNGYPAMSASMVLKKNKITTRVETVGLQVALQRKVSGAWKTRHVWDESSSGTRFTTRARPGLWRVTVVGVTDPVMGTVTKLRVKKHAKKQYAKVSGTRTFNSPTLPDPNP
jgi:subtilisin family serine protease